MIFTVKCPYCKGSQGIEVNLKEYEDGSKYYDCQHCMECFEVNLLAKTKQIEGNTDRR
jgi:transposase-like protein